MAKLTIEISDEIHKQIKMEATSEGLSIKDFILKKIATNENKNTLREKSLNLTAFKIDTRNFKFDREDANT
jgi:uncharacterized protein (DUF1778 family)